MSQAIRDFERSFVATTDLSAAEFLIVKVDTANDGSVVAAASNTDPIVGVLQNKPKATEAAVVRWGGSSKVIAGGTITRGDLVTSDSSGHAITTTTNKDVVLGRALMSAVSGDIFEVALSYFPKNSFT